MMVIKAAGYLTAGYSRRQRLKMLMTKTA
jgi:hypothetical protein